MLKIKMRTSIKKSGSFKKKSMGFKSKTQKMSFKKNSFNSKLTTSNNIKSFKKINIKSFSNNGLLKLNKFKLSTQQQQQQQPTETLDEFDPAQYNEADERFADELKDTKTADELHESLLDASAMSQKYKFWSKLAESDGHLDASRQFTSISQALEGEAQEYIRLLAESGDEDIGSLTSLKNIELAMEFEKQDSESFLPSRAQEAFKEKFFSIADLFTSHALSSKLRQKYLEQMYETTKEEIALLDLAVENQAQLADEEAKNREN